MSCERDCSNCLLESEPAENPTCTKCLNSLGYDQFWQPKSTDNGGPPLDDTTRHVQIDCGGVMCAERNCTVCYPVPVFPTLDQTGAKIGAIRAAAAAEATPENPKARHGAAKPNLALIPSGAQLQIAPVFQLGAAKYGRFNWRKDPVEAETYVAAAQRHMLSWFDGEDTDPESGELHLAHAAACLMILLDAKACSTLIDNRPHAGAAAELIRTMTKPIA